MTKVGIIAAFFCSLAQAGECVQTYTVRSYVPRTVHVGQAVELFDSFQVDRNACYCVYDIDREIRVPWSAPWYALYHLWDDQLCPGMTDTTLRPVYRVPPTAVPGNEITVMISITWSLYPGGPKVWPGISTRHVMKVVP